MKKYKLTDEQVLQIARLCNQEQGSIVGARAEASLMANQLETSPARQKKYGTDGDGLYNWVRNGGWFYRAAYYMDNGKASAAQVSAVREVLCDGERTLPQYVDEHDSILDIRSVTNNGKAISPKQTADYIPNVSVIKNNMGSTWTFYSFPAIGSDPFGYTSEAYDYVMKHEKKPVDRLIATATAEVGYCEKASGKSLDSKTGNAGSKNYTKYARDVFPDLQGLAWCAMFVVWCFVKTFGKSLAKRMLGGLSADCDEAAEFYKSAKRWFEKPQVGDQIFFVKNGNDYYHTGIVYKVSATKVYTIEGNTSSGSSVVPNGGMVCKKAYDRSNARIGGYGRPNYALAEGQKTSDSVKASSGRISLTASVPEISEGSLGTAVRIWQAIIDVDVDGDFGPDTKSGTIKWQKAHRLTADGIVGRNTWLTALRNVT